MVITEKYCKLVWSLSIYSCDDLSKLMQNCGYTFLLFFPNTRIKVT